METESANKEGQFLWFSPGPCVDQVTAHRVRQAAADSACIDRLARLLAHVPTPTTKESHMTNHLCAFTRGHVAVGTAGMPRA